VQQVLLG
jgi:hypothetical protein